MFSAAAGVPQSRAVAAAAGESPVPSADRGASSSCCRQRPGSTASPSSLVPRQRETPAVPLWGAADSQIPLPSPPSPRPSRGPATDAPCPARAHLHPFTEQPGLGLAGGCGKTAPCEWCKGWNRRWAGIARGNTQMSFQKQK